MNYAIVRPPGLVGDDKDTTITQYQLDQGDRISGRITRCTLSYIIRDLIESKEVPPKVTFECSGSQGQQAEPVLSFGKLKADTDQSLVKSNHKTPKYVYGLTFFTLVASSIYLIANKLAEK